MRSYSLKSQAAIHTADVSRIYPLIVLTAAISASEGHAQSLPPLDEYHIRAFGVGDGLLAADVTGLAQTRDGYLYVASGRGLARFDGYRFHRVVLTGFRSNFIEWLFEDSRGRLWVFSRASEIGYVREGRLQWVGTLPLGSLGVASEASDGGVWVGGSGGLVRVSPGEAAAVIHFTTAHGLPTDSIVGAFDLPGGERVVVTYDQLIRVATDSTRPGGLRFVPFGPRYVRSIDIRADAKGLWLAFPEHVLRYHDGRFTRYGAGGEALDLDSFAWTGDRRAFLPWNFGPHLRPGDGQSGVYSLSGYVPGIALLARDGTRWLSFTSERGDGDQLVRQRAGRLETIPLRPHLEFKVIQHMAEDHEGSLWLGTDRGLFQLSPRAVFALTRRHGLTEGFTVPVLQTSDGALWVGTWGGGLHRFADGRLARRFTTRDGLPDNRIRALYEASDGILWVGTAYGFAAIQGGRVVLSESSEEEVRAFAETADGESAGGGRTLWVGTAQRLLFRTPQRFASHRPDHWRGQGIWALHTTRDGTLWIGSERGLFRLAGDTLRTLGEAEGLRSSFVVSIYEEADGTLWFGTYEYGLHRYRGGRFAAVTTHEGLHHDGVWRMLEDGRGGLWMSSDAGIFRVDRHRLHAVADAVARGDRPAMRLTPLLFTEAEGIPTRESNRGSPGGWRLRDGRLVFNNLEGVVVIDPVRAIASPPPPRTVIHAVLADGRPVPLLQSGVAKLPPGTKQLVFDVAALSFVAPEQNRYRYRVDGYDETWVQGGTQRRASYTNLPPGRYTFRVQGASGVGAWREPGAAYAFVVEPFVWQTWWFRLLVVAAVAGLLAAAYRYRVGRLLEMQRLRVRIASDLHDDVGSNLSSIALLSEMLKGHSRLDDLEQRQLQRIHHAAEETIGALRDVIWLVDPKHDDLADLVAKMRGAAGDLLNGTAYAFEAAEPRDPRPLGMTFMRNVLLIYKEALHNVVKHARARRVDIAIIDDHGLLVMRIRDDGVGFVEPAVRPGHGLENMRRRAQQAGGRLDIVSAPQQGTQVTFSARMA